MLNFGMPVQLHSIILTLIFLTVQLCALVWYALHSSALPACIRACSLMGLCNWQFGTLKWKIGFSKLRMQANQAGRSHPLLAIHVHLRQAAGVIKQMGLWYFSIMEMHNLIGMLKGIPCHFDLWPPGTEGVSHAGTAFRTSPSQERWYQEWW